MKLCVVTLVLCVCTLVADADIAHVKAAKAKLLSRLAGKHHKQGVLSHIPPYKVGYDIPHVTHSLLKPLVVTYPPTATVAAVKIPVPIPHAPHFPVPVGHKVPGLPHPHYGLKFPHTKFLSKPDHHFHHHHHHVAPSPVVPVVPPPPVAPVVPVAHAAPASPAVIPLPQPAATLAHPVPVEPTPIVLPAPEFHQHAVPLASPPLHFLPQNHLHFKPLLPAATVPLQHSLLQAPAVPLHQPFPYVIRPGGAVQTSVFATYPRFPFINSYQAPLIPLAPAQAVSSVQPLLYQRPHVPQLNILHSGEHGIIEHHTPNVAVEQTPTLLHPTQIVPQPDIHVHQTPEIVPQPHIHLHPTQLPQPAVHLQPTQSTIPLDNGGWSPVPAQPIDISGAQQPEAHYPNVHQFTQEQGTQVYEHHDDQFHNYQHQLQHHIQQIEQAQYEQNLNSQHHVAQEYGTPQQEYGLPNEYSQQGQDLSQHNYQQDFSQHGQDFAQHGQDFSQHGQDFSQHGQDFSQHGQDFSQNGQDFSQHGQDFAQHGQDFSQHGQSFAQNDYNLSQQYGLPQQGVEGRSSEDNNEQSQFHNHIPLALQPPLDRPLEHF